ncbi:hypothetical protein BAUCODRAFT_61624 [Baudoinia panamericana UAMH 10762]|uniref:Superoxide dismutase copper/zinc binding domain-containing protein n=1 Tax=Baudoinia panamericana (strain UAMH 10762) TaxID=717646 RepID=M2MVB2_BAUPA|nr:uncharacterized protein BAUCODRAFT_61624 [Baudoinia panamericana UAMH 10762]EMD00902.1 hypothetical protein BAUCODRAFT_61624 [Baudoinia panamericana UAMH 10762]
MRLATVLYLAGAYFPSTILAQSTTAPAVTANPQGAQYIATLPNNATWPMGSMVVSTAPSGMGVSVQISISNLPPSGGPFHAVYSINMFPVNASGNCSITGGPLDPYNVTEAALCDPNNPATCQVGDMSGKHGPINGTNYAASYNDAYLSTQPNTTTFMGNCSLVVYFANKTRLSCANFTVPGRSSSSFASPIILHATSVGGSSAGNMQPLAPGAGIGASTVADVQIATV